MFENESRNKYLGIAYRHAHLDEINATMSVLTGIDMTLPAYQAVEDTFNLVKQQLPSSDDISTFLSAHEIGVET